MTLKNALKPNEIKVNEPTAIEPLSKELLLGMNGRFVYLVQRFENSEHPKATYHSIIPWDYIV